MDTMTNSDFDDQSEIPASDLPAETAQPETQGEAPVEAELGEEGQGDLAPEDLPQTEETTDDGPRDLRTEDPAQAELNDAITSIEAAEGA